MGKYLGTYTATNFYLSTTLSHLSLTRDIFLWLLLFATVFWAHSFVFKLSFFLNTATDAYNTYFFNSPNRLA